MPEKTKDHALNTWLRIAEGLILILGSAVSCLLTTYCLLVTGINTLEIEKVYLNPDDPLSKLAWVLFSFLGILVLSLICRKLPGKDKIPRWFVRGLFVLAIIALWIFWTLELNPGLHGDDDTGICWSAALLLSEGNYDVFAPLGYLVRCPQQLGIVLVNLLSMVLLGQEKSFVLFYVLNLALYLLLVLMGVPLVKQLCGTTNGNGGRFPTLLWGVAAVLNLPLFFYIDYMYGELAFAAGVIAGTGFLIKILNEDTTFKTGKARFYAVSFLLITGFAVALRQNALVYVIAVLIILFLEALLRKRKGYLILAGLLILVSIVPSRLGQAYFRVQSGESIEKGMGASLYIAMGLQDEWNGPGWFTNFNQVIYFNSDGDPQKSHEVAADYIRGRLSEFREEPEYGKDFLRRKIQTQWTDPSCDSLYCTLRSALEDEKTADWIRLLLAGANLNRLWKYLDLYQAWVYVGFSLYMLLRLLRFFFKFKGGDRGRRCGFGEDLLILTVIGGFLFSILWEAKSRYVMQYELAMLPMAIAGYCRIAAAVTKLLPTGKKEKT